MRERWQLRAAFARALSDMYGREVPAYTTLVEVATQINAEVAERDAGQAERLGSIARVTAERHGAIRLGTPAEMAAVARVFAGFGMYPVGFYDLRDASTSSVPVVSTAFRPIDREELARNPFRVFTSVLTADDRRFFSPDVQAELANRLEKRQLFDANLLALADRSVADDGLPDADADEFVRRATAVFELSTAPVDRRWYETLEAISSVAADIGGVGSTHINHLTPRVLDIDELYRRMTDRGITMIDEIQGPPRWDGPDVLLRQTSFRALAEPRRFREADGSVTTGQLRVRFGEVEARGIALTPVGRARYDELLAEVDRQLVQNERRPTGDAVARAEVAREVWTRSLPTTERDLDRRGLGYFTYRLADTQPDGPPPTTLADLCDRGWVVADPIVYEDFLPRSAAGIFASNLSGAGSRDEAETGAGHDLAWLSGVLEREVADPMRLYAQERADSLAAVAARLGLPAARLRPFAPADPTVGPTIEPAIEPAVEASTEPTTEEPT